MTYLALYRKYRPTSFESIYGQQEIVTVIRNAIKSNKVSHAYLFSGPRGTGKTTIAKILARTVNCENLKGDTACGKCYNCQNFLNSNDIVEIDAASNNGVDEIRELRNKINLVPTNSKYKVYIIDEVHMLTVQAFNALLKTLEEPPSHVIFILATTEPHKIPLTISSRCQKFSFKKISVDQIILRLKEICKLEKIEIDEDAINEIAKTSDGGMRDAINLLDQIASYSNSKIKLEDVYEVNGLISYNKIYELINAIVNNDKSYIINFFDEFDSSGKNIDKFLEEFMLFIKDIIIYKNIKKITDVDSENENIFLVDEIIDSKYLYELIEVLNEIQKQIKLSNHGNILFMTSILKYSDNNFKSEQKIVVESTIKKEKSDEIISREIISEKELDKKEIKEDKQKESINKENNLIIINNAFALASKEILNDIKSKWNLTTEYITNDKYSLAAGLLKESMIVVGSNKYIILIGISTSVVDRINENINLIEEFFLNIFKYEVKIVAITKDQWKTEKENYINNTKKGIKYEEKKLQKQKKVTPVDELIDLMGNNIIEYREGE